MRRDNVLIKPLNPFFIEEDEHMIKELHSPVEAFRINMQTITDYLEDASIPLHFHKGNDGGCLIGVKMYNEKSTLSKGYVYFSFARNMPYMPPARDLSFIVLGTLPAPYLNSGCNIVQINDDEEFSYIFNLVQNIFEKCRKWDEQLQYALNHDLGITELCKISVNFFNNPLFIHDSQFYVIACPIYVQGMLKWEFDQHSGMKMAPWELINDFKTDPEYISTLNTTGAQLFSANLRGYRVLYINIRSDQGRYLGRICVDELVSPLKPIHFIAIEYFAKVIQIAMNRHNIEKGRFSRPFELVLSDILDGKNTDCEAIAKQIETLGWKLGDKYICINITGNKKDMDNMAGISTCNYIEAKIKGSYACKYQQNIIVIVNLSMNGTSCENCLAQLAYIIREGLFKAGVSSVYRDFTLTHYYSQQAELALKYGEKNNNTIWCHRFDTYVLRYMLDCCSSNLPSHMLCAEGLRALQRYDAKNETEFYKTLTIYLKNERRTTQTANELYIHRSTLFYRLERIEKILQMNLEDPETRLYLNICIHLIKYNAK